MALSPELEQAREFLTTFARHTSIPPHPTLDIEPNLKRLRVALIQEETQEVSEAIEQDTDLAHIAKELADLQYVVNGTIVSYGFHHKWPQIMTEVHRSNMSKTNPDGSVTYHPETGKVLKSDTYSPADIDSILNS